ncbi:hypothetical protein [Streptomyces longisporoflavus]|nr:hypothetical protein [Streptomyces longisporoflavus]
MKETRVLAVVDSVALLRRVERDLHVVDRSHDHNRRALADIRYLRG